MIIRFTPEADAEIAEARHWYAHQREDLEVVVHAAGVKLNSRGQRPRIASTTFVFTLKA